VFTAEDVLPSMVTDEPEPNVSQRTVSTAETAQTAATSSTFKNQLLEKMKMTPKTAARSMQCKTNGKVTAKKPVTKPKKELTCRLDKPRGRPKGYSSSRRERKKLFRKLEDKMMMMMLSV